VKENERSSQLDALQPFEALTPEQVALREAENALRQFDRIVELIRQTTGPAATRFKLRPSALCELNHLAVDGLVPAAGVFRTGSVTITGSTHEPPPWKEVPRYVDDLCDYVNDNWAQTPIHLAAYVMWRLNWVHPFADGNGRTSRACSYLVLCAKLGYMLPSAGATIPDRIAANKLPYYHALDAADAAYREGSTVDVSKMEGLLEGMLARQLVEVVESASGKPISKPEPPGPAWNGD
jgi:Fic family protein